MDLTGTRIGPYALEQLLGVGGVGQVYRARSDAGRIVALKVLGDEVRTVSLKRLRREVKVLQALSDRHVVAYVDADLDAKPPYLAMQFIEGQSLMSVLGQLKQQTETTPGGVFPHAQALKWGTEIARGLAAAHRASVLHRDLKPANVMIDRDDRAVLIDFGLARTDETQNPGLTGDRIIGTIMYFSPEQALGRPMTTRSDVYQWALIMFELLVGTLPDPTLDPMQAIHRRASHGVKVPRLADPRAQRLGQVVQACLAADPMGRPEDGDDLLERLEALSDTTEGSISSDALAFEQDETAEEMKELSREFTAYELVGLLGRGGMGAVYEGRNRSSGERVAIKFIHTTLSGDPGAVKRFEREARILAKLQSLRIVRILDFGRAGSRLYLVTEFLEGETAARRLSRGRLMLGEALEIVCAVAEGITELHSRGIVHRDLKPANLMLTPRTGARILDLGIAKDPTQTRVTATGDVAGTLLYAAPEMMAGQQATPATDVFQVGLIFYELVTGRSDFRSPDAAGTLRGFLFQESQLVSPEGKAVAAEVVQLFLKATAVDPGSRHADGRQLSEVLGRIRASYGRLSAPGRRPGGERSPARPDRRATGPAATPADRAARPESGLPALLGTFGKVASALFALLVIVIAGSLVFILPEIVKRMGR